MVVRNPGSYTVTKDIEFHAPQHEAAIFYGMFLRGCSEDQLRKEIDVPPKLLNKWMRLRDFDPNFRENLRKIYVYRKQVLAIFNSLIISEKASRSCQKQ